MSLQSPANIAGTFNQTSYNGGTSSGSIIYHSTHVDGSAPASGRYYYRVFVTYDPGTEDNWIYFNTSDNKWYDHDQVLHDPTHFTVNGSSPAGPSTACSGGETVALIDSNGGTIFTFTHPTWFTSYSQYDTTNSFTSQEIGTTYTRTWTCNGIQGNAVRYYGGTAGWAIAFNTSGASTGVHTWRDDGNQFPYEFSNDQQTWYNGSAVGCPDGLSLIHI